MNKNVYFLCGALLVMDARASLAQQTELEEITVSARKRDESLQNVPVAVTAIPAEALKNNLATDLTTIAELAPQVSIGRGGAGTAEVLTIRGISTATIDAGLEQSVATEIDGIPLSRGAFITSSMFDLAGVQVLEGPQALFFGKNSPAGVISIHSAEPTDKLEGYATSGYEFVADERFVESAISGPLNDTLKARLAVRADQSDGWMRDVAPAVADPLTPGVTDPGAGDEKSTPKSRDVAGRLTFLWTPLEDFSAELRLTVDSQDQLGDNTEPFCINGQKVPVWLGATPIPGGDCSKNMVKSVGEIAFQYAANFPNANDGVPYSSSFNVLDSLTLNKKFDNVTLTSTTGYANFHFASMYNFDWSPFGSIWSANSDHYSLVTEELRSNTSFDGPFNASAGVYFEHFSRPFSNAPDIFHTYNPVAQTYASAELNSMTTGNYASGFGQLRWNIISDLELAAGARFSHDEKDTQMENAEVGPAFVSSLYPQGVSLRSDYSNNHTSPEVTLTWHPEHGQTLYGAYKTGYKGGATSIPSLLENTATAQNLQFKPEISDGFEAGYKAILLNNTLRFDLTGYRYNYKDLQVVSYDASTISFTIGNAARALIWGAEGSAEWLVAPDLTLRGNFGYNEAKYTSYPNAECFQGQTVAQGCVNSVQNLAGRPLARAPLLDLMLGADYKLRFASRWLATLSVSGTRNGSYNADPQDGPGGIQDAFWLLNAAVHVGPQDGKWDVAFVGRNLTDSYYMLQVIGWSGSLNNNQYVGWFNRPREVAIEATVHL
jgi:iron complex outermembrane recepter protein